MFIVVVVVFSASGCYTKLMTPQEFVHTQRYQSKKSLADNSYSVNYNQSCVTCHSVTELNERAEDLEYYGVRTVHNGISLSSRLWIGETVFQPNILVPTPSPYWPSPYDPVTPWWAPLGTTTTTTLPSGDGNRIRNGGVTRDENREGERSAPISSPTYTQPQTPVGGTTPVPSTPAPAVQLAPSTTPAQQSDSGRTRESNDNTNSSSRTRSDGATRDDNGNRPR